MQVVFAFSFLYVWNHISRRYIQTIVLLQDFFASTPVVYHNHNDNDVYHNCNTIHTQIQIIGELCCSRYERFINFLTSAHSDMRRETQFFIVFANHTMLSILSDHPQYEAHLVIFKISIHLYRSGPKKLDHCRNGRKLNSLPQRLKKIHSLPPWSNLNFNWLFFKILKFSAPSLPGITSSTLQPHFISGVYYDLVIVISLAHTQWLCTWTLNPNSSKPNQTEW